MTISGNTKWLGFSLAAFLVSLVLLPWAGPAPVSVERVLSLQPPDYPIFLELRLSRTLLGLLVGGSLSLAGALFQAMLRDSLATPYTLGVSSGASLGAILSITAGLPSMMGLPAVWLGALGGAAAVLALVAGVSSQQGQLSSHRLLLTGISLNGVCSAMILMIHSVAREHRSISITQWLLGNIDSIRYPALGGFAAVAVPVSWILISRARQWNLLMVGEAWAATRGVDPSALMRTGFLGGSLLTATAIALSGPIGFVGLIVPHLVRSRISPDYRLLMPVSFLLGGVLLAVADAIGRVVLAPAELPAGAIMALLGGPYLVWLVRRRF
jgi:iron complex transport system permease protein